MNKKQVKSKKFQGKVVSAKMQETAVVSVVTTKIYPKYQKRYKVTTKYHCQNDNNQYREGDEVVFIQCRPLSKTKRWRIIGKVK